MSEHEHDPDFDELTAVNEELTELEERGCATRADFDRLLNRAERAVGVHTEFLEGILMRGVLLGFVNVDD